MTTAHAASKAKIIFVLLGYIELVCQELVCDFKIKIDHLTDIAKYFVEIIEVSLEADGESHGFLNCFLMFAGWLLSQFVLFERPNVHQDQILITPKLIDGPKVPRRKL